MIFLTSNCSQKFIYFRTLSIPDCRNRNRTKSSTSCRLKSIYFLFYFSVPVIFITPIADHHLTSESATSRDARARSRGFVWIRVDVRTIFSSNQPVRFSSGPLCGRARYGKRTWTKGVHPPSGDIIINIDHHKSCTFDYFVIFFILVILYIL